MPACISSPPKLQAKNPNKEVAKDIQNIYENPKHPKKVLIAPLNLNLLFLRSGSAGFHADLGGTGGYFGISESTAWRFPVFHTTKQLAKSPEPYSHTILGNVLLAAAAPTDLRNPLCRGTGNIKGFELQLRVEVMGSAYFTFL